MTAALGIRSAHLALKVMPNDLHIYFIKICATYCNTEFGTNMRINSIN
jgi:hypothetical protein